jgi:hypothetical protein
MSSARADAQAAVTGGQISGMLIAGVLIAVIFLFGVLIWVALPPPSWDANDHYAALLGIGILGIIVSVLAVVAEAMTRDPPVARAVCHGSFWFGIAVLLGNGLVSPDGEFGGSGTGVTIIPWRLVYIIIVMVLAVAGLLVLRWRFYSKAQSITRESQRQAWRARTGAGVGATGAPSPNDPRMQPPPVR